MPTLLLEGPFESDYSLAIVNRNLARALAGMGVAIRLHQRDNTTAYFPDGSIPAIASGSGSACLSGTWATVSADAHSRNIYPPYTDGFRGKLRVMHCYAWEETVFPQEFVEYFNRGLDLVTVTSGVCPRCSGAERRNGSDRSCRQRSRSYSFRAGEACRPGSVEIRLTSCTSRPVFRERRPTFWCALFARNSRPAKMFA